MQNNLTKAGKPKTSSALLQTVVFTGSLAATVVGAGLISRMEVIKNSIADSGDSEVAAILPKLEPIPTIFVPLTTNASTASLPTATPTQFGQTGQAAQSNQNSQSPAVIPTDTAEPTWRPAPTATPTVIQRSTQTQPTTRVRRRSRSSR